MRSLPAPEVWPSVVRDGSRRAPKIIAKDTSPAVRALVELDGGDFAVLETAESMDLSGRLVRRSAALECLAVLPDVQGPAALSPDRRWLLAGGPHLEGKIASAALVDVMEWRVVRTLPFRPPFAWVDDETFVAQNPEGLVLVNRTTLAARCVLRSRPLDDEVACAFAARSSLLFSVTGFARISAVRIDDGTLVFQHPPSKVVMDGTLHDIAYNEARSEVVAVGAGPGPVRFLDAATGADRLRWDPRQPIVRAGLRPPRRFDAIAVHADGRVAIGSNTGILLETTREGTHITASQVATRAIQALAYTRDGNALIIGGSERNLRILPLD